MCGIAGFWRPEGEPPELLMQKLRGMTDCLAHRGPDADGHWVSAERGVALGHRRLSIVDLSPTGAQPMHSASGRFVIVFNGEIYNYRRLRDELSSSVSWIGSSDTEVMLAAFERWGVAGTLPRLGGMFAFAVWDRATEELWLARDRMGEKPLYIAQFDGSFVFGSEIKSIRRLPNFPSAVRPSAIAQVLRQGYIGGRQSAYAVIDRLRPAEFAVVSARNGAIALRTERYWSVTDALSSVPKSESDEDATDRLDALLTEVVTEEMVADVPVGAFLSGGIDSSLVVSLMQKVATRPVRTFTIGFRENSHDESPFARDVAAHLGTDHTEIMLSSDDALAFVERLPGIFDEPFADSSQLPTLLVSSVTRQHVTVALSGDGGDELFGGYSQYTTPDSIAQLIRRVPVPLRSSLGATLGAVPNALLNSVLDRGSSWGPNARARLLSELHDSSRSLAYENLVAKWVAPATVLSRQYAHAYLPTDEAWPASRSEAESRMAFDMEHYMPDDILVKVDRSAMASSLETRAPLIEHRVVEFALRTPLEKKIRDGRGKFLLRHLLARYVPQRIINRPKRGFSIPLATWLRGPLREWVNATLEPDNIMKEWFQPAVVNELWQAHLRGGNYTEQLWPVLMIMQWLRSTATT